MPLTFDAMQALVTRTTLTWRPAMTSNTKLEPHQVRARLGALPPGGTATLKSREHAALAKLTQPEPRGVAAASAPPASFDWRSTPDGNFVTAVKDQAGCGSCVAFGTTAVLESMVRITAKQPRLAVNLSEAFVFFCLGPSHGAGPCPDGGWWADEALTAMKAGVPDDRNYPYTDLDQPCRRGSDWKSRLTKFSSWTRKTSLKSMKSYLSSVGPMVACFTVYEDFFYYYAGGIYQHHPTTSGEIVGGHCVAIIGYDDVNKCWIAKNSWGTGWGDKGYFRIAYGSAGIDAEMWGIDGTVSSPLIRTRARLVASGAGNVWHTARSGSGSWQQAVNRLDTGSGDPGMFTAVTAAATINRLHVFGLVNGKLWYTRQRSGAGWAKWAKPTTKTPTGVAGWTAISCAAAGDVVHLTALADGVIWHTRRTSKSNWQGNWVRVSPATGGPGKFTALSLATNGTETILVGVAAGKLWLTTRKPDGSWSAPAEIIPGTGSAPGTFTAVGTAVVAGRLNLVALCAGRPWHLERDLTGTWGTFTELTSASPTAPTSFTKVALADTGRTLQVLALAGGKPWHRIRKPDGSWAASFGNVGAQITGEPAVLDSIDIA